MAKALISPIALFVLAAISFKRENQPNAQESDSGSDNSNEQITGSKENIATLYVGNIPYKASEKQITEHFEKIATVHSIRLMKDKRTGKRKGFGFIEIPPTAVEDVIHKMNESIFMERNLIVRPAKDKII